jgi:hypothetical protein
MSTTPPTPGSMNDRSKAAFTAVADLTKQLLTITAGILTITVTFSKDLVTRLPDGDRWTLTTGWLLLVAAAAFGIWTLMALAGSLAHDLDGSASLSPYRANVLIPATLMIITFLAALVLIAVAGWIVLDQVTPTTTLP